MTVMITDRLAKATRIKALSGLSKRYPPEKQQQHRLAPQFAGDTQRCSDACAANHWHLPI
ncbi:hypothetical protein GCM10011273_26920 [Asticcacaulis endophyticus]|uniref:Uncharacterized protein n=1 Tax=Asticcacaulis endophyticus TaxID=1395890 RepID=A0A918UWX7_9CAUL|nr:hypothetical protein GCM10011273_26920 [Asticcacaulis endophyticus]